MNNIAFVGCCHGKLNIIYETLNNIQLEKHINIKLLLICGDFQSLRNKNDLNSLSCPDKYKEMGDFYEYYSGNKTAPILTILVSGNHESSNYLQELYCGGWIAPKIYYLGYCGCIKWCGLRICGLSGIYNKDDYFKGIFEYPPYNESTKRSIYHIREWEIECINKIKNNIDIMLTHDWPCGIANYGDLNDLYKYKKYLKKEIENNQLGSIELFNLLLNKKPKYWFSAHHHVKYPAIVKHSDGNITKFLALDKVLPYRDYLQIIEIPIKEDLNPSILYYDEEWLSIIRKFHNLCQFNQYKIDLTLFKNYNITNNDINEIKLLFNQLTINNNIQIPFNFSPSASFYELNKIETDRFSNLQTDLLFKLLHINHQITITNIKNKKKLEKDPLEISI